ncbi:hypothetical protein Ahy_A06g029332 isoform B [Arachis hypogaea]|uniref:Uncharacterized protein n=1 Tax=Arachis hypogaea TaxID=3818 RepID=A0A445CT28_ARAHY|nr:hypothetical protein Ahy_A06g029332 isoform B [Arachis hypogaea]
MRRRDKRVEGRRLRKKEEAIFALLCLFAVRRVTVVTVVRDCVTGVHCRRVKNPPTELWVAGITRGNCQSCRLIG